MNVTEKYIKEHEYVFSLPRKKLVSKKRKKVVGWSLHNLLKLHLRSLLVSLVKYPLEIWRGRNFLQKTFKMTGYKRDKTALVIGNGPSQGYLTVDVLNRFVRNGGETYCVNYWTENKQLSSHIPTWMVFSDPATFEPSKKSESLISYLLTNDSIKVVIPSSWVSKMNLIGLSNDIYVFIDTELTVWKNISPLYPRGYLSMTLYKALAWAVHLGYSKVGVIGMDNTYPRNLYNDPENRTCNLETHAGEDDFLSDVSDCYCVAVMLDELVRLFSDLEFFPSEGRIVNLDRYSLTDRFVKIEPDSFFGILDS